LNISLQKKILEKYIIDPETINISEIDLKLTEEEREVFDNFWDYESVPIGGDNPYYMCSKCEISDPQINSNLFGHSWYCEYIEHEIKKILNYKG